MKRQILLVLFCALSFSAFSQTNVKIYGFYRDVLPGTIPKGTDEDGKVIPRRAQNVEYLLYINSPSKFRLYPVEVWINGTAFSASGIRENNSPVQTTGDLGKTIILVPKTSGLVQRIVMGKPVDGKKFPNAKAKSTANDVVIVYKLNGKFYSAVLKRLQKLEPVNHV